MKLLASFVCVCCLLFQVKAQYSIKGIVKEKNSKQPIAFASVYDVQTNVGCNSDIDGKFELKKIKQLPIQIKISCIGYKPITVTVNDASQELGIYLEQNNQQLDEVVLAEGINPAIRIMSLVIKNKSNNNPFNYSSFKYNAYTKAGIGTSDYFWQRMLSDTVETKQSKRKSEREKKQKKPMSKADSLEEIRDSMLAVGFMKNYMFFTESYTERIFKYKSQSKETVLATKMTGIKQPNFAFTSNNFQPFGFYDNFIEMLNEKYQSPIMPGAISDYKYVLKETHPNEHDTSFVIAYRPKKGKNFKGLSGSITVRSGLWAVENITAEPANASYKLMTFKLQQLYSKVSGKWFPAQLNTIITNKQIKSDSALMFWDSKTYITHVAIDSAISDKSFNQVTLEIKDSAALIDSLAWTTLRTDTLSTKDKGTYNTYSLLPKEVTNALNNTPKLVEALALEAIPWGKVDLPFKYMLNGINKYESFRLGLGVQTNSKWVKWLSVGGFAGYGIKDKSFKYGANLLFPFNKIGNSFLRFSYKQDVEEPGNVTYFKEQSKLLNARNLRQLFAFKMDSVQQYKVEVQVAWNKNWRTMIWGLNERRKTIDSVYAYQPSATSNPTDFIQNTEIVLGISYDNNRGLTNIGRATVPLSRPTKQLLFQLSQSVPTVFNTSVSYTKAVLQFNNTWNTRKLGIINWQLSAGHIWGNVPYSYLFNTPSSNAQDKQFQLYIPQTFQTLQLYQYATSSYASLSISQQLGQLLWKIDSKYTHPELVLTHQLMYGRFEQNNSQHYKPFFKGLQGGLYESGIILNNLVRFPYLNVYYIGLGVGAFYRYGENSAAKAGDNFCLRTSFSISF